MPRLLMSQYDLLDSLETLKGAPFTVHQLAEDVGCSVHSMRHRAVKMVELGFATRVRDPGPSGRIKRTTPFRYSITESGRRKLHTGRLQGLI